MSTLLESSLTAWGISSLDEDADGLALLTEHLQKVYDSEERNLCSCCYLQFFCRAPGPGWVISNLQ